MLNSGLALGAPIQKNAQSLGASEAMMSNAVWLPCLYAGAIPGIIYCLYLMRKKRNNCAIGWRVAMVLLAHTGVDGAFLVRQHHVLQPCVRETR